MTAGRIQSRRWEGQLLPPFSEVGQRAQAIPRGINECVLLSGRKSGMRNAVAILAHPHKESRLWTDLPPPRRASGPPKGNGERSGLKRHLPSLRGQSDPCCGTPAFPHRGGPKERRGRREKTGTPSPKGPCIRHRPKAAEPGPNRNPMNVPSGKRRERNPPERALHVVFCHNKSILARIQNQKKPLSQASLRQHSLAQPRKRWTRVSLA